MDPFLVVLELGVLFRRSFRAFPPSFVGATEARWSLWNGRVSELSTGRAEGVSAGLAEVVGLWRLVLQRLVRALGVVKLDVLGNTLARFPW